MLFRKSAFSPEELKDIVAMWTTAICAASMASIWSLGSISPITATMKLISPVATSWPLVTMRPGNALFRLGPVPNV